MWKNVQIQRLARGRKRVENCSSCLARCKIENHSNIEQLNNYQKSTKKLYKIKIYDQAFLRWKNNKSTCSQFIYHHKIEENFQFNQFSRSTDFAQFITIANLRQIKFSYPHQNDWLSCEQNSWEFFNVGSWRIQHDIDLTFVFLRLLFSNFFFDCEVNFEFLMNEKCHECHWITK